MRHVSTVSFDVYLPTLLVVAFPFSWQGPIIVAFLKRTRESLSGVSARLSNPWMLRNFFAPNRVDKHFHLRMLALIARSKLSCLTELLDRKERDPVPDGCRILKPQFFNCPEHSREIAESTVSQYTVCAQLYVVIVSCRNDACTFYCQIVCHYEMTPSRCCGLRLLQDVISHGMLACMVPVPSFFADRFVPSPHISKEFERKG